jgi:hypothetical protein
MPLLIGNDVIALIAEEREAGRSLRAIAEGLNAEKVPTAHGGARWHASTVKALVERVKDLLPTMVHHQASGTDLVVRVGTQQTVYPSINDSGSGPGGRGAGSGSLVSTANSKAHLPTSRSR